MILLKKDGVVFFWADEIDESFEPRHVLTDGAKGI
jgi:hypothetical protein